MPIPYAKVLIVKGKIVRVCPMCDKRITERADRNGEQTSHNYADHVEAEHPETVEDWGI